MSAISPIRTSAVALVAALSVALAACGGDDDGRSTPADGTDTTTNAVAAGSAVAPATEPDVSATSASTGMAELRLLPLSQEELGAPAVPAPSTSSNPDAVPIAEALAPYAAFGTDAAPGAFPRTIRHAMGETEIIEEPQRIVVLDVGELDAVVQVGIVPVGAVEYTAFGLPPFIVDQITGVELVGTTSEPNLEAVAALQPDLILSNKLRHEAIYDQLAAIAPTVFAERPGVAFRHNFALFAQAVGREQGAAEVVARYEDRVRQLNAALPAQRPTTAIVQLRDSSPRYYQRANFLGTILTDLGFPRPPGENVDDFGQDLSEELLAEYADGDLIILAVVGGAENTYASAVLDGPVWQALPAVQAGQVLEVDTRTWIGGVGYGAAFEVLDGLAAHFGVS